MKPVWLQSDINKSHWLQNYEIKMCSLKQLNKIKFKRSYHNVINSYNFVMYTQSVLQGSTLQPTPCSNATVNFYHNGANDECSRGAQRLFNGTEGAIIYLYNNDCPTRFRDYVTNCSDAFGDEVRTYVSTHINNTVWYA